MSLPATIEQKPRVKKKPKRVPFRRSRVPAMARKAAHELKQIEDMAVHQEEQNFADHEKVKTLSNRALGGSYSAILKNSPLLNDEEKTFLKELGYF